MAEPKTAKKEPAPVMVEAGRKYAWCACGESKVQPLCDATHKRTGWKPVVFEATETKEVWLCQCKHTKTPPYCDGTHKGL